MTFYHIDRLCSIKKTGTLDFPCVDNKNLFGTIYNKLSAHGYQYLATSQEPNWNREYEEVLEHIRAVKYSHYPSRFQSLFASRTFGDALFWALYYTGADSQFQLVEIESDIYEAFDCSFFTFLPNTSVEVKNNCAPKSLGCMYELADNYWAKKNTNTPIIEVLIPLPCMVKKISLLCKKDNKISQIS